MVLESEYRGRRREGRHEPKGGRKFAGLARGAGGGRRRLGALLRLRLCGQPGPAAGGLLPDRQAWLALAAPEPALWGLQACGRCVGARFLVDGNCKNAFRSMTCSGAAELSPFSNLFHLRATETSSDTTFPPFLLPTSPKLSVLCWTTAGPGLSLWVSSVLGRGG